MWLHIDGNLLPTQLFCKKQILNFKGRRDENDLEGKWKIHQGYDTICR